MLIDGIDDETALQMLYEDAVEYTTSSDVKDEELTDAQWTEVELGLKQIENGETYTHEEVMQRLKVWRNTKMAVELISKL